MAAFLGDGQPVTSYDLSFHFAQLGDRTLIFSRLKLELNAFARLQLWCETTGCTDAASVGQAQFFHPKLLKPEFLRWSLRTSKFMFHQNSKSGSGFRPTFPDGNAKSSQHDRSVLSFAARVVPVYLFLPDTT